MTEKSHCEQPQAPLRMTLEPPIEYDGRKYGELVFHIDELTEKDFLRAELITFNKSKRGKRRIPSQPPMHLFFCTLAAQAADAPVGVIQKLSRRFYMPLRMELAKAYLAFGKTEKR